MKKKYVHIIKRDSKVYEITDELGKFDKISILRKDQIDRHDIQVLQV